MEQSSVDGAKKKGLPGLAWVVIGCGSVVLLVVVVILGVSFYSYQKLQNHKKDAAKREIEYSHNLEEQIHRRSRVDH